MKDIINPGDIVVMRKPHPCGSTRWRVFRMGADVGLFCCGCERRLLMPRRQFNKAVKSVEARHDTQP